MGHTLDYVLCNNIAARTCSQSSRSVFTEFASDHYAIAIGIGLSVTKEVTPSIVNTCMRVPGSMHDNPIILFNTLNVVLSYIRAHRDLDNSLPAIRLAAFATTLHQAFRISAAMHRVYYPPKPKTYAVVYR